MKLRYALLLLLVLSPFSMLLAQTPGWNWSHAMGGQSYDVGSGIASDHNGNVINCGYYYDDTLFVGNNTLLCAGNNDMYIAKYSSTGNLIWARREGSRGDDYAISVSCNNNGDSYVTGYFVSDTLIIGTDTMLNTTQYYSDIFVAKYDPNGNPVWAKSFGGGSWDIGQCIYVDPNSGNIYLAGCYYDSSIVIGANTFANGGAYDILLVKMDQNGNVLWADHSGGSGNDMCNAVTVDNSGNAFISGGFMSATISFASGTLTNAFPTVPDIFVAKYNAAGTNQWCRRAGDVENDHSVCIATDPTGNIFVGGHYHSMAFAFAGDSVRSNGMGDIYLLKYDSNGNEIWGRGEGGDMHDFGFSVAVDQSGNAYISGMFNSSTMTVGTDILNNNSMAQDMVLIKYDNNGNHVWAISYGGNGDDEMNSITCDNSGAIYCTGDWRSNTMTLGASTYVNTDSTIGYADIFVGKIDMMTGMLENNSGEYSFRAFPNPTTGRFKIQEPGIETCTLFIYNSTGKLIKQENNFHSDEVIDLSDQASGIYFVHFNDQYPPVKISIIR